MVPNAMAGPEAALEAERKRLRVLVGVLSVVVASLALSLAPHELRAWDPPDQTPPPAAAHLGACGTGLWATAGADGRPAAPRALLNQQGGLVGPSHKAHTAVVPHKAHKQDGFVDVCEGATALTFESRYPYACLGTLWVVYSLGDGANLGISAEHLQYYPDLVMIVLNKVNEPTPFHSEFGNLQALQHLIAFYSLTGPIPSEIGRLTKLVQLYLLDLESSVLWTELGLLKDIQVIHLAVTHILGTIPSQLFLASSLADFYIGTGGPTLVGTIPSQIGTAPLVSVTLNNGALSGAVPSELLALSSCAILDLYKNQLDDASFEWLDLPDATYLSLSTNAFTFPLPSELARLTSLLYLDLAANQITGTIPSQLARLTALTSLHLGTNNIGGTVPSELARLTALDFLNLDSNPIEGALPSQMGLMSSLTLLSLRSTNVESLPTQLGALVRLTALSLADNSALRGPVPDWLFSLTSLVSLDLFEMGLSSTVPASFALLTNLGVLQLQDNILSGTLPQQLASLTGLTDLRISNNRLTGTLPVHPAVLLCDYSGVRDLDCERSCTECTFWELELRACSRVQEIWCLGVYVPLAIIVGVILVIVAPLLRVLPPLSRARVVLASGGVANGLLNVVAHVGFALSVSRSYRIASLFFVCLSLVVNLLVCVSVLWRRILRMGGRRSIKDPELAARLNRPWKHLVSLVACTLHSRTIPYLIAFRSKQSEVNLVLKTTLCSLFKTLPQFVLQTIVVLNQAPTLIVLISLSFSSVALLIDSTAVVVVSASRVSSRKNKQSLGHTAANAIFN